MAGNTNYVTITVRIIRSFEHRNVKYVIFKDVDLAQTTAQFIKHVLQELQSRPGIPPPLKKYKYDTLKIEYKAHKAKTSDPVINMEDDKKLVLNPDQTLVEGGVENETELSLFKLDDYEEYKKDPVKMAGF